MKKRIVRLISLFSLVFLLLGCQGKGPITLSEGEYSGQVSTIGLFQLDEKIANKNSFVLYVTSPSCTFCQSFAPYVEVSSTQLGYTTYKLFFTSLTANHVVYKKVKFTPAILVFYKGSIRVTLDSTKNQDTRYFESLDNYNSWIKKYILF